MKCAQCKAPLTEDDADICSVCGDNLCMDCVRTPDPEKHDDTSDYCLEHYIQAGYADLWEVQYMSIFGDVCTATDDVEPGTNTFQVLAWVRRSHPLWSKLISIRKVRLAGAPF